MGTGKTGRQRRKLLLQPVPLAGPLGCPAPPAQRQAERHAGFASPGGAVLLEALLPALRKVAEPELRKGRADVQKRAQAQQYWL